MSILIKGMKIPKDSIDFRAKLTPSGNLYIYRIGDYKPFQKFKAIEIPPHGRLIDADALTGKAYMDGKLMCVEMDDIEEAPTIIEAEERAWSR